MKLKILTNQCEQEVRANWQYKQATNKCEVIVVFHLLFRLLHNLICKCAANPLKDVLWGEDIPMWRIGLEFIPWQFEFHTAQGPSCHHLHHFCSLRQAFFLSEFARRYVSTRGKKKENNNKEEDIYNTHCLLRRIDTNNGICITPWECTGWSDARFKEQRWGSIQITSIHYRFT